MTPDLIERSSIFIVDDEQANLRLLNKLLARQGYHHLVPIQDSREVLARYQAQRPDLILLDISMPHLDGYQVMAQLNALNDPFMPPIIVITAEYSREQILKALTLGARDLIGKPFDHNELLMRVRNLLDVQLAQRLLHDQKAVLEDMVRMRTEDLKQTRLQVVRRLGRVAEYRDNETGLHIVRMSQVSALLARSMGWSADQCELMLHASPMHDIGKIGIRDEILLKPGKLTVSEFNIMKTHASIGADMLAGDDSELLQLAHTIALSHHEKWDGSGYPGGLIGQAIPMAGRIVAVADVFDALTSSRPYKEAWPVDKAVAYITENSGKHFDPDVVVHFLRHLPEIIAIVEFHAEPA
ncbi:HD domain-containing phosphohydrolase [Actimicrobium antarcticum]|uniref:Two-component system response regulator n=1 Tax=Actimicrobium antarcticum TaxID=1051899 RepID=A0ABP7SVI4_9BURK